MPGQPSLGSLPEYEKTSITPDASTPNARRCAHAPGTMPIAGTVIATTPIAGTVIETTVNERIGSAPDASTC